MFEKFSINKFGSVRGNGWCIYYGEKSFDIYNPFSVIGVIAEKIYYATKSFFSILSGFVGWQEKFGDEWEDVDLRDYNDTAGDGNGDAYYVCAKYNNGRHIPLPILFNWDWDDDNKLQKIAIKVANWFST